MAATDPSAHPTSKGRGQISIERDDFASPELKKLTGHPFSDAHPGRGTVRCSSQNAFAAASAAMLVNTPGTTKK